MSLVASCSEALEVVGVVPLVAAVPLLGAASGGAGAGDSGHRSADSGVGAKAGAKAEIAFFKKKLQARGFNDADIVSGLRKAAAAFQDPQRKYRRQNSGGNRKSVALILQ